jgi:hypothetical protein
MSLALTATDTAVSIAWIATALGGLTFAIAVVSLGIEWSSERHLRRTAKHSADVLGTAATAKDGDIGVAAHSGVDAGINAIANLARALKDLDRSSRLLVMSVTFLAVAAALMITGTVTEAVVK